MHAGELRSRVTFQEPSGSEGTGYSDVATGVPAKVEMMGGSEVLRYGAQSAAGLYKVTVRFRTDVRPDWRMVDHDARAFQIVNYGDPTGRREWTEIAATELR